MTGPQVVLVTGGSSGIGLATARAYARRGSHVVLAARSPDSLDKAVRVVAADGAASVRTVVADVVDESSVQRLVDSALAEQDHLDVVVHSATVMAYGRVEDLPAKVFEQVVDVAIHGTAHLARHVLPVLRRQQHGSLIIVNSLVGSIVAPSMGAYATAKWGQLGLARTLQLEARTTKGVHVGVVTPGSVNTPIYYQAANVTGRAPRPPWPVVQPEAIARGVLKCADHRRRTVSVGPGNPVTVLGFRLFPWVFDRIVTPAFNLAALTKKEQAPTDGNVFTPQPAADEQYGHWPVRA